jgi:uncharacterized protein
MKDYPEAKPVLLYRGIEKIAIDGILCIPVTEFLLSLDTLVPPDTGSIH